MSMGPIVYVLCTATMLLCTVLLVRGYMRARKRLLLWSGLCFAGLTLTNALVFVDLVVVPEVDLYPLRLAVWALSMALLLYGLIWEAR